MNSNIALTREQTRELDRITIEEYGVDGLILMENAGRGCARQTLNMLESPEGRTVIIFCGTGNNGGDGFVVARHLANQNVAVECCLIGHVEDALQKDTDAAVNLRIVLNMNIPVHKLLGETDVEEALMVASGADLIVDALLGTGISGDVRGLYKPLIEGLNAIPPPVLAIDVPSGLDCDTGRPLGTAIEAACTMTFIARKQGYENEKAEKYVGRLGVVDIGMPRILLEHKAAEWQGKDQ